MTYAVRGMVTWVCGLKCRMAVKMIAAGDTARVSTWSDGSRSVAEIGEFRTCIVVSGFVVRLFSCARTSTLCSVGWRSEMDRGDIK